MHGLVFLKKLSGKDTRRLVEGTIFRPLLQKVTYRMLLLLPIIQGLF